MAKSGGMPAGVRCPICRVEVSWEGNPYRPFCSERCRLIDLGAWTGDQYRIPGEEIKERPKKGDGEEEESS